MCVPPPTRQDRCKTCTPRASRATRPPSRPRPAEVQRRAAHAPSRADGGPHSKDTPCATAGASRSCENGHIKCRPRSAIALPSSAGLTARPHHVPLARRDRSETSTHRATHATQPPPPTHPPPWPGEGLPGVAHTCAATDASRLQREKHAPCCSRDATALPSHGLWRARAGQHMRVPPPARHGRSETSTHCAARATRLPSSATASRGPTPCSTLVCRHRRVTIVAR